MDDVGVDSVGLIVNGRSPATFILLAQQEVSFSFEWNSNNFEDGAYLIEIRAWDASGNIGFGSPISFRIWNNRPRVIWVPDEYETIQDAIWESRNGDAIMVRMGDYHEQLQFFDKSVSLISESGPEETTIDGTGYYTGAWVTGGQDTTMLIRGFTFRNDSEFMCYGAVFDGGASPKIVNNIFTSSFLDENRGINMGQNAAIIRNNLFINLYTSVEIAHSWGDLTNNMFLAVRSCLFNKAINGQLLVPDYNLFWDYEILIWSVGWGAHNIVDQEPLFEEGGFRLRPDSPGVNDGRPDISDLDNSCSDIGIYGGPYAYLP
jgi:hypothetical protein